MHVLLYTYHVPLGFGAVDSVDKCSGLTGKLNTCISVIKTTINLEKNK